MHQVEVRCRAREFVPGQDRVNEFEETRTFEIAVLNKLQILRACMKYFGRCTGTVLKDDTQIGWAFEGKIVADTGDISWWETQVIITKGFKIVGQIVLT